MLVEDFDYHLPAELIAQRPVIPRDGSRLMVLEKGSGRIRHHFFKDLPGFLDPGDLLVLNDTRVIPARFWARRSTGGRVEVLLLNRISPERWETLVRRSHRLAVNEELVFGRDLSGTIEEKTASGKVIIRFCGDPLSFPDTGQIPLPPYIKREPDDRDREDYQTVYARYDGSVAAPTAGLHFNTGILDALAGKGVIVRYVTTHIGWGTFRPVRTRNVEEHRMEEEFCSVGEEVCEAVRSAKGSSRRVFAVGTSVVRALETGVKNGSASAYKGGTGLFIYPPYDFRTVDCMLTNFHLPGTTLIMLVSALAGRGNILRAYDEAVRQRYRFYSYGDAMLII